MAAASKYFAASLGSSFQESGKSECLLEGTDGETVKSIVDFCYTGEICLTEENVRNFLVIASSVQLDLLEVVCHRFLEDNLTFANCVDTLILADKYSATVLRQRAIGAICSRFDKLPINEIQKLDQQLLGDVLKSEKIEADEELVFKRLMEWFQSEESVRKQHIPELLKSIRLELIPQQVCLAHSITFAIHCINQSIRSTVSQQKLRSRIQRI